MKPRKNDRQLITPGIPDQSQSTIDCLQRNHFPNAATDMRVIHFLDTNAQTCPSVMGNKYEHPDTNFDIQSNDGRWQEAL